MVKYKKFPDWEQIKIKNVGQIIAEGTPEEFIKNKKSVTGEFLKKEFER